ncbi:MAG: hypothetical protein ACFFCW_22935 [Candidatus Hodarchaeota archaeon]
MKSLEKDGKRTAAVVVGLSITGLGTIRSLARSGIRVIGVDSDFRQPSAHTRYCEKVACPDVNSEDKLLETLISISKENKSKPVLFLSSDTSVLVASENMELLKNYYHFNLPSRSVVKTLMDKAMFSTFAEKNGHQIPKTFVINNLDDVKSLGSEIHYPCIMKPPFRGPTWDSVNRDKAFKVFSEEQLINLYKSHSILTKKFIIQEWIPGPDSEVYFCLLWYNSLSQPVAAFTGRKIMQWPPEMGSTCIAESCNNSIVQDTSIRLLNAVGYKGIGSVEFKRDPRDNVFKITEPTVGRVDLQSEMACYYGINIPLLEYYDCLGLSLPKFRKNSKRIYWVHEENLFWLLGYQRIALLLKICARLIKNTKCYALFNLLDIKPFLSFLCWVGRMILNKLMPRRSKSLSTGGDQGVREFPSENKLYHNEAVSSMFNPHDTF